MRRQGSAFPAYGQAFGIVLLSCLLIAVSSAAPTTSLHIVKYSPDGMTIINETTADYRWLEQNLPVQGDGKTHYYHQGPVFTELKEDQWDRTESKNFKDMGAVKGTAVRDLSIW